MPALAQQMSQAELASFLPHKGPMLLLHAVEGWDESAIECVALSHNDQDNPLRMEGRVSSIHAMEYGAQAAAVHLFVSARAGKGALAAVGDVTPEQVVYLGVVRGFEFLRPHLDDRPDSRLNIRSELVSAAPRIFQYQVDASIDRELYARGVISLIVG